MILSIKFSPHAGLAKLAKFFKNHSAVNHSAKNLFHILYRIFDNTYFLKKSIVLLKTDSISLLISASLYSKTILPSTFA